MQASFLRKSEWERATVMMQVEKLSKKTASGTAEKRVSGISAANHRTERPGQSRQEENFRAANAEEALIAYLFQNNDMAEKIRSVLAPEQFSTAF